MVEGPDLLELQVCCVYVYVLLIIALWDRQYQMEIDLATQQIQSIGFREWKNVQDFLICWQHNRHSITFRNETFWRTCSTRWSLHQTCMRHATSERGSEIVCVFLRVSIMFVQSRTVGDGGKHPLAVRVLGGCDEHVGHTYTEHLLSSISTSAALFLTDITSFPTHYTTNMHPLFGVHKCVTSHTRV
jgi:hypothetical protein